MTTAMATMATVEAARIICGSYPAACSLKTRARTRERCRPSIRRPGRPGRRGPRSPSGDIPAHWCRRRLYALSVDVRPPPYPEYRTQWERPTYEYRVVLWEQPELEDGDPEDIDPEMIGWGR
jgi:hypothetical protein